jgi:hypothetical protein
MKRTTSLSPSSFPLLVALRWSETMQAYVAEESIFDWYGLGDTPKQALRHLEEVAVEDFAALLREPALSPMLQERLLRMRKCLQA